MPPSLVWVHSAAALSRRFCTWLDKACVNYNVLLRLGGVVNNTLRREKLEELTGEARTKFTEALMEYDKLEDELLRFSKLKAFNDFVSLTDENLIKWVGDEWISLGYCGFRERSSQYWLWDYRVEKLPYKKKVRDVLSFYGLDIQLQIYGLHIPTQEQSETMLFEFLENVKKWPRSRIVWLVRNVYPLTDETGGFWVVAKKIMDLVSLSKAWEILIDRWTYEVEGLLKETPQYELLKVVLVYDWEANRYIKDLIKSVKEEFVGKYGETVEDPAEVKRLFITAVTENLKERVAPEEKLREVYEQIKPLIRPELVDLTRAGLWKAIRWAFLHPQISVDAFASAHVFPLGFTTEESRTIAAKIMEKVLKKPPPAPSPIKFVKVLFLEDMPAIVGVDMKVYGPFKKREVYELPEENAEAFVKKGVAVYEAAVEEYERELANVKRTISVLYKFERLAYFLNHRLEWRFLTVEDQKEILKEIVKDWTDSDYQTFYSRYADKVKEVAPVFSLLGLPLPPPPIKLTHEDKLKLEGFFLGKLAKAEVPNPTRYKPDFEKAIDPYKSYEENLAIVEKIADDIIKLVESTRPPPPELVPPPIPKPVPKEEQVIQRECYDLFSKLWNEIKKGAAMEVAIPEVSMRTGLGAELIRKALSRAYIKNIEKVERLANDLLRCECLKEKSPWGRRS